MKEREILKSHDLDLQYQDKPTLEEKYKETELTSPPPFGDVWDIRNVNDTGRKGDPLVAEPKSHAQFAPASAPKEFSQSMDRGFTENTSEFGLHLNKRLE